MIKIRMSVGRDLLAKKFVQVYGKYYVSRKRVMEWLYDNVSTDSKLWLKGESDVTTLQALNSPQTVVFLTGYRDIKKLPKGCSGYVVDMRNEPDTTISADNVVILATRTVGGNDTIMTFVCPDWGTSILIKEHNVANNT